MRRKGPYRHKVQYYETDQMQIVHHSNYIRWFEEARVDFMERKGLGYDEMEKRGIVCPVLEVQTNYLRMTRFGDTVYIKLEVKKYNGIKLIIGYQVVSKETGMVHCTGETKHCFLNQKSQPMFLKRDFKDFHEMFLKAVEENEEEAKEMKEQPIRKRKRKKIDRKEIGGRKNED